MDNTAKIMYLEKFTALVERGKTVLDVGCGDGKPVDEYLVKQGLAINGIDSSEKMIVLARKNVPGAFYEIKGILSLQEGEYCVNGIVALSAISHLPKEKLGYMLKKFASFMPNGGALLIALAASEWEGTEEHFHEAGFTILLNEVNSVGNEKRHIILARS